MQKYFFALLFLVSTESLTALPSLQGIMGGTGEQLACAVTLGGAGYNLYQLYTWPMIKNEDCVYPQPNPDFKYTKIGNKLGLTGKGAHTLATVGSMTGAIAAISPTLRPYAGIFAGTVALHTLAQAPFSDAQNTDNNNPVRALTFGAAQVGGFYVFARHLCPNLAAGLAGYLQP